jgi:hypothetical protein
MMGSTHCAPRGDANGDCLPIRSGGRKIHRL